MMHASRAHSRPALLLVTALALACAPAAPAAEELGRIEFPATGAEEARPWFERGVAALHSFWYDEAADAFRRAREADPGFVMAYWGEAMTHNHPVWDQVGLEAGRAVLEGLAPTAEERAAKAPTARERAYLEAVEILFFGDGEKEDRDRAYEEAMGRLAESFPDDPEARIFHALPIEGVVYGGVDEELRFPMLMRAAASLEELFDRFPEHPGVLHYLIHAYDDPVHAPLGLRPARLYARVAPAAHHALHMPSHIFVQLGRWDEAAASNEDAWQASVDWVERRDLDPGKRDFHSLSWLLYVYLQEGRYGKAEEVLDVVREAHRESPGGRVRHARHGMEARYLVETRSAAPPALLDEDHAGPGTALAVALAAHEERDLDALRRAAGAVEAEDPREGSAGAVQELEVAALVDLVAGREAEGLARLEEAVRLEDELGPPSGPPDTLKPARELLGEVLLDLGRAEEAVEHFAVSLRRTPRRALSLLGAARGAAATGDRQGAAARYRELLEVWDRADADVAGLDEARRYLEGAQAAAS